MRYLLSCQGLLTLACLAHGCSSSGANARQTAAPPDAGTVTSTAADAAGADADAAGADAADAGPPSETVEARLHRWLTGRYDSSRQAARDMTYLSIELTMCPVDALDYGALTLYVEQARTGAAPYRQRLYVIEPVSSTVARSRVFEFAVPSRMTGFCSSGSTALPADVSATPRDGCDVVLGWDATRERFTGGTVGKGCGSTLNGASYATSEVLLESTLLLSWDRGFDARDQQVWGATAGGYVFDRLDGPVGP